MHLDYVPVNIDELEAGLQIGCNVYFKKEDDLVFLCKDVTLTQELIDKFKTVIYPDDMVYISKKFIKDIFKKRDYSKYIPDMVKNAQIVDNNDSNEYESVKQQYESAVSDTVKMFCNITENNTVNAEDTENLAQTVQFQLESNDISLILQSISSIRKVDEYLHTHSLNVAFLNGLMGKWLKYDKARQDDLVKIGLLHDIGKLRIPPEILNKPGRLTKEEFEEIKTHPYYSFEILVKSGNVNKEILQGVIQHHEKLNGTGYPYGIGVEKITEYAKITSISDIYDAMVAKRVYKDAHSPFEILENFAKEGYSELDIKYVKLFINCMIEELKGKLVVLSDGSVAKVLIVKAMDLKYPIVEVDGNVINTSPDLYCVSMFNSNVSAEEVKKLGGSSASNASKK